MSRRTNGEGSIYKRTDGRWCARYTFNGKRRDITGKTQTEVKHKLKSTLAELEKASNMGNPDYIEKRKTTLEDWLYYWLETFIKPTVKPSTYSGYERDIRNHVVPAIGHYKMCELNLPILQEFFNSKKRTSINDKTLGKLSAKSIKKSRNMMNYAFRKAQEHGILLHNILSGVITQAVPKREIRVLTPMEQDKLIATVKDNLETWQSGFAIIFALFTGVREGELLGLRWMDIDLNPHNPIVRIRHSLSRQKDIYNESDNNSILKLSEPKTNNSIRDIPIIKELYNDLLEYKKIQCARKTEKGKSQKLTDFVFPNKNFTAYEPRGFFTKYKDILDKCKLYDVNVHTLRHTFATRSLERGMDIKALSKILGHARPSITLDRYGSSLPNHQRECMNKLSSIYLNL